MQIYMKACYKLILRFFDGYGQAFLKFPKKQVSNVFTISLKKSEMKVAFSMKINIKVSVYFNPLGIKVFCNVTGMIVKT